MADQPQQQVTPEMLQKLQGKEKKDTKAKPVFSGSGSRHWIIKFAKDIAYISFFPYLLIKEFFSWLFANKQGKKNQVVNINKTDNPNTEVNDNVTNNKGEISLQEVESSTSDIPLAEATEEVTNSSNNTGQPLRNRWTENMASNCAHHEPPVEPTANNNRGLTP